MKKLIIIAIILIIIGAVYLYWGNNSLTVGRHRLSPANLPDSFSGFRIVQISDLHNKDFGGRLTEKIGELNPDIIVITGDIIDSRHTDTDIALKFAENAVNIAPVYYVTGNHESRLKDIYPEFRESLENIGIEVLDCRSVTLERNGDEIVLAGMNDPRVSVLILPCVHLLRAESTGGGCFRAWLQVSLEICLLRYEILPCGSCKPECPQLPLYPPPIC